MGAQIERIWDEASEKLDAENHRCRICGCGASATRRIERGHVSGREFDDWGPCRTCDGTGRSKAAHRPCKVCKGSGAGNYKIVRAVDVIPICGPTSNPDTCHAKQHAGAVDLLGHLSPEEEAAAVIHFEGLENARRRLAPSAYPERAADAA